jgi:RNA polymerase-interacting CarD/CdnL/TRCF family regulator
MVVRYKKGDHLIYPHHGACTVEKFGNLAASDVKQEYLTLRVTNCDLLLKVPLSNA